MKIIGIIIIILLSLILFYQNYITFRLNNYIKMRFKEWERSLLEVESQMLRAISEIEMAIKILKGVK